MSALDELLRMPPAYCEKRPGSPGARRPRAPNGRPVDLFSLFEPAASAVAHRLLMGRGTPLQHEVGYDQQERGSQVVVRNFIPDLLSPSKPACRLDAYMDLADHAELGAKWSLEHLMQRVQKDPLFQSNLLLWYFWGEPPSRAWCFFRRPDVELAVRMAPLLGRTSVEDLQDALDLALGGQAEMQVLLDPPDALCPVIGNLATPMVTRSEAMQWHDTERTRSGPPVIGPAPLVCPVVKVIVHSEAEAWAKDLSFRPLESDAEVGAESEAEKVASAVASLFVSPHVRVQVAHRVETEAATRRRRKGRNAKHSGKTASHGPEQRSETAESG